MQALLYFVTGRWVMLLLLGGALGWHAHAKSSGTAHADVTELVAALPRLKKERLVRLAAHAALLASVIVLCVPTPRRRARARCLARAAADDALTRARARPLPPSLVSHAVYLASLPPAPPSTHRRRKHIPSLGSVRPAWERD